MIIVFANQKGGVGKSTCCIQFANYLSEQGIGVVVADLDFQQSIHNHRKNDKEQWSEMTEPFDVVPVQLEKAVSVIEEFKTIDDGYLLIDLPGKIDDENVIKVLEGADIIICPFKYDELTVESTMVFGIAARKHLHLDIPIFFVPNGIRKGVRYDLKQQVYDAISKMGIVTKEITQSVKMERISTLFMESGVRELVEDAFNEIINKGGIHKKG